MTFHHMDFLRKYAPDFCWCSTFDLFLMAEQVDEDVDFHSFEQALRVLWARDEFVRKKSERPGPSKQNGIEYLYLRRIDIRPISAA